MTHTAHRGNDLPGDFSVYLNFHGIGEPGDRIPEDERPYWLAADRFDEILGLVRHSGADARITFDDGNLSDRMEALPILQRHGLAARFFVPSDRLDQEGYLSRGDIKALVDAGMSIGSHGDAHRPWTGFSDRDLADQLARSVAILSDAAATPVTEAAAPFGAYNARVLRVVRASGISRLFTSDGGAAKEGRWLVPRNTYATTFRRRSWRRSSPRDRDCSTH